MVPAARLLALAALLVLPGATVPPCPSPVTQLVGMLERSRVVVLGEVHRRAESTALAAVVESTSVVTMEAPESAGEVWTGWCGGSVVPRTGRGSRGGWAPADPAPVSVKFEPPAAAVLPS